MTPTYIITTIAACIVSSTLSIAIAALFFRFERRYGRRRSVRQYEAGEIMTSSVEVEAAIPRTLEEGEEKTGTEEENSEQQTKTEKKDKTDQRDQHSTTPVVLSETALMVYEEGDQPSTAVRDSSIRLVRRDLEDKLDFGIKQSANGEFYITDLIIADSLKEQVKEGDEIVSCEIEMKGFPIQLATAVIQSTITNMSRLKLRNRKNRGPLTIPVITVTDMENGGVTGAGVVQASVVSTPSRSSSRSSRTTSRADSRRSSIASRNRNSSPRK